MFIDILVYVFIEILFIVFTSPVFAIIWLAIINKEIIHIIENVYSTLTQHKNTQDSRHVHEHVVTKTDCKYNKSIQQDSPKYDVLQYDSTPKYTDGVAHDDVYNYMNSIY
jgi:hypothetical protein